MTEIEQLKADLATLEAAQETINQIGKNRYTSNYWVEFAIVTDLKKRIADLEAQQELIDPWKRAKEALFHWDANDKEPDYITKRSIFAYIQSLQAKVDELNHELRCERIDGGKVRDDLKARIAEMEQHGRKVDQANHEHYGRLQDQIAIRDLKIEKLERQAPAERNREKLAELTTIANAIPPACELARELVERRIEGVKKQLQETGAGQ